MTLIDSSAWIAYFLELSSAPKIEGYLQKIDSVVIPTVILYEVFRQLIRKISDKQALFFVAQMQEGKVKPLSHDLALQAAELSLKFKLGTADAIIYATALTHRAKLVTLDNDFRGLPNCVVLD